MKTAPYQTASSSHYITEGTGGHYVQPTVELGALSRHLILSKILIGPCAILLLLSSLLLSHLILRHFRSELRLYFSLLVYTSFQMLLVAVLIVSPVVQLYTTNQCPMLGVLEHLATILPGYGVVMVTAARWVCASYPLRYNKMLDLRTQAGIVVVVMGVLTGLTCLPLGGICRYSWRINVELRSGGYCVIDRENKGYSTVPPAYSSEIHTLGESSVMDARHLNSMIHATPSYGVMGNGQCDQIRWALVGVGYIVPFSLVLFLYCLIVKVLYEHKRRKLNMKKKYSTASPNKSDSKANSKGESKPNSKADSNQGNSNTELRPSNTSENEQVSLATKFSEFRTIGLDAIPWSVLVILTLSTLSALLWIPHIFVPQRYYDTEVSQYLVVDLANGVMMVSVSVSPLAYILTTPNMRTEVRRMYIHFRNMALGQRTGTISMNHLNGGIQTTGN